MQRAEDFEAIKMTYVIIQMMRVYSLNVKM